MSVEFRESETLVLVVPPAWAPGLGSGQAELPTSRVDPGAGWLIRITVSTVRRLAQVLRARAVAELLEHGSGSVQLGVHDVLAHLQQYPPHAASA